MRECVECCAEADDVCEGCGAPLCAECVTWGHCSDCDPFYGGRDDNDSKYPN